MNTISKKILQNAVLMPDKVAIIDCNGTRETTWTQLLESATKIACHLRREGICGIVPILQGRTMEYVASMLGINMAGLAATNLLDTYPEERIRYICEDVDATACVDATFVEHALAFPVEPFEPCGDLDTIAMLLYTSGSTGKPKGIVYDNNCLLRSIERNCTLADLNEHAVYGSTSSFAFAVSQLELLAPLSAGATLHILTEDCRRDGHMITMYFNHYSITHAFLSVQLLRQMNEIFHSIKLILTAGERVAEVAPRGYKILCCYAMSETTAFTTSFILDKFYENTPIGKPSDGMSIYLLDENGNPADEGEICIAGPIAKGYWKLPELTAKTFVPNPFATSNHDKVLLHTGDLGRRLPDGNYLFLNRKERMVKINGQRVEPGEIEVVMHQLPEINQVVIKDFISPRGQNYLCGFYTTNAPIATKDIRTYLAKYLPDYMQPRFLVQMKNLPLNANGKLDMLSLAAPEISVFQSEYVAPTTPEEELLCSAFERVLGVECVGVLDDFFSMGGDSLGAMTLANDVKALNLQTFHIFSGKTPEGIAKLLQLEEVQGEDPYQNCHQKRAFYPLTDTQKKILKDYQMDSESTGYNMPQCLRFPPEISPQRLQEALREVVEHYPIFKIKIEEKDGVYGMVPCPERVVNISITDVTEEQFREIKKQFVRPFDIQKDLFFRCELYKTPMVLYCLLDFYHIVSDGYSRNLFFEQLNRAYYNESLIPEDLTQFDLSNYEQLLPQTSAYADAKKYFQKYLMDNSWDCEPAFDHPQYARGIQPTSYVLRHLSERELKGSVEELVKNYGIMESTLFLGAFGLTLAGYTGKSNVLFLTVERGRDDARLLQAMGAICKMVPVAIVDDKKDSPKQYLQRFQDDLSSSINHDCYPISLLSKEYGLSQEVVCIYQGDIINDLPLFGHNIPQELLDVGVCSANILCFIFKHSDGYDLNIIYNAKAYEPQTMERFGDLYVNALKELIR